MMPFGPPTDEEVLEQLEDIAISGIVTPNPLKLLRYVVEEALAGRAVQIKDYAVAVSAFGLSPNFDPGKKSNVRTHALYLRNQLAKYYESCPKWQTRVIIEIPTGGYRPVFSRPDPAEQFDSAARDAWRSAQAAFEKLTLGAYLAAIHYLEKILRSNPNHPLVLAIKADVHAYRAMHGMPPRKEMEMAEKCARLAVEIAPNVWQAQVSYGFTQAILNRWENADKAFAVAAQATKDADVPIHPSYASYLISRGKADEAIRLTKKAVDATKGYYGALAPASPVMRSDLAFYQILGGNLKDAEETLDSALADSDFHMLYIYRAVLQEARDDYAGAAKTLDIAPFKRGESVVSWGIKGLFHGLAGHKWRARFQLARLLVVKKLFRAYVPPAQFASSYLGVNDYRNSLRCVRQMAEEGDPMVLWLGNFPFFRHLARFAEFHSILNEHGLQWQWKPMDRGRPAR